MISLFTIQPAELLFCAVLVGLVIVLVLLATKDRKRRLVEFDRRKPRVARACSRPAERVAARCPECGTDLPADAPEGLCPQCLLKGVIISAHDP